MIHRDNSATGRERAGREMNAAQNIANETMDIVTRKMMHLRAHNLTPTYILMDQRRFYALQMVRDFYTGKMVEDREAHPLLFNVRVVVVKDNDFIDVVTNL